MKPIIEKIRLIPPPRNRECEILLEKVSSGDKSAAGRIVEMYLRTALCYALRAAEKYSMPLDDIFSATVLELAEAFRRPSKCVNYFAHIYNSMQRGAYNYVKNNMQQSVSYEDYCEKIKDSAYYDGEEMMIHRIYLQQLDEILQDAMHSYFMDDRDANILTLRFGLRGTAEHSRKEIADMYGTDVKRIRYLENRALSKLKHLYSISKDLKNFFG